MKSKSIDGRQRRRATFECVKCRKPFSSLKGLVKHAKNHPVHASRDIKMLQSGRLPDISKAGSGFKGKNKVIVT